MSLTSKLRMLSSSSVSKNTKSFATQQLITLELPSRVTNFSGPTSSANFQSALAVVLSVASYVKHKTLATTATKVHSQPKKIYPFFMRSDREEVDLSVSNSTVDLVSMPAIYLKTQLSSKQCTIKHALAYRQTQLQQYYQHGVVNDEITSYEADQEDLIEELQQVDSVSSKHFFLKNLTASSLSVAFAQFALAYQHVTENSDLVNENDFFESLEDESMSPIDAVKVTSAEQHHADFVEEETAFSSLEEIRTRFFILRYAYFAGLAPKAKKYCRRVAVKKMYWFYKTHLKQLRPLLRVSSFLRMRFIVKHAAGWILSSRYATALVRAQQSADDVLSATAISNSTATEVQVAPELQLPSSKRALYSYKYLKVNRAKKATYYQRLFTENVLTAAKTSAVLRDIVLPDKLVSANVYKLLVNRPYHVAELNSAHIRAVGNAIERRFQDTKITAWLHKALVINQTGDQLGKENSSEKELLLALAAKSEEDKEEAEDGDEEEAEDSVENADFFALLNARFDEEQDLPSTFWEVDPETLEFFNTDEDNFRQASTVTEAGEALIKRHHWLIKTSNNAC